MLFALLLLLAQEGTVQGTVRSHPSGEPLPHAAVVVPALDRRVAADARGYYVLADLPAGTHRLTVVALGHDTASFAATVPEGGTLRMDLRVPIRALTLDVVEVRTEVQHPASRTGPGSVLLDRTEIKAQPALAEADVFRAVQALPAIAAVSDFSSAPYLRGSAQDHVVLTLDGAPLINPYHLAGLFSAIDPEAIAGVEVIAGALPASEPDRLGGAIHITTREGGRDRFRTTGGVGMVSSRIGIDGPLPGRNGSMLLSVRRTYVDAAAGAARTLGLTDHRFPYAFVDTHLKLTHDVGADGTLSVSGYLNDERFRMPTDWASEDVTWGWGSRAGSVRYRTPFADRWLVDARAGMTAFSALLESWDRGFPLARSEMSSGIAAVEVARYAARHRLTGGIAAEMHRLDHDVTVTGAGETGLVLPAILRDDLVRSVAFFVSDEWTPEPRLGARAGVRVLHVLDGATVVMPRLGARMGVRDGVALTLGGGRYAQTVRSLRDEESFVAGLFAYDLLVGAPPERPATSWDAVLGAEWTGAATALRVEAFTRAFDGMVMPPLADDPLRTPALVASDSIVGSGTARGVEALLRHQGGRGSLMVAYTLAYSTREVEGMRYTPRFNRRHTADATGTLRLGATGQGSARLAVASGQPFTPLVARHGAFYWHPTTGQWHPGPAPMVYGPHNSQRLPSYLRLDLGVRKTYRRRFLGQDGGITPYFQVLNAIGTRNVLWASPAHQGGEPVLEYGPQLPTLPTLGFEWRF
jgi:hypothetical protein